MGMLTSIPALAGAVGVIIGGQLIKSLLSGKEKYLSICKLYRHDCISVFVI
jgi:hypothetical protein